MGNVELSTCFLNINMQTSYNQWFALISIKTAHDIVIFLVTGDLTIT